MLCLDSQMSSEAVATRWGEASSQKPGRTVVLMPVLVNGGIGPVRSCAATLLLNAEKPITISRTSRRAWGRVYGQCSFDTSVGRFRFDGVTSCQVSAISDAAGTSWTVSTAAECTWARLIRTRQVKGKTVEDNYGPYYLPFEITVSLKQ